MTMMRMTKGTGKKGPRSSSTRNQPTKDPLPENLRATEDSMKC